ncbi:uncharacterized protein DUF4234 [Alteromonadaceae bacterium 2753L.S.0a.02]|nr:uncharacterized protein DUF4234 [Alteromonadaceae bacterium 2753L.S.0a.02]
MENDSANPYKAPESEVASSAGGRLSEVFERFSAWGVFGLSLITLGLYAVYWLYTRTQQLNQKVEKPINSVYVTITLILYVMSFASNFVAIADPAIGSVLTIAGLPSGIMMIVWVFMVRGRIHDYLNLEPGNPNRFGPLLTFFFSVLYLQYKINKTIDQE